MKATPRKSVASSFKDGSVSGTSGQSKGPIRKDTGSISDKAYTRKDVGLNAANLPHRTDS